MITESAKLNFRLTKRIFTDPARDALVMRHTLTPLGPNTSMRPSGST